MPSSSHKPSRSFIQDRGQWTRTKTNPSLGPSCPAKERYCRRMKGGKERKKGSTVKSMGGIVPHVMLEFRGSIKKYILTRSRCEKPVPRSGCSLAVLSPSIALAVGISQEWFLAAGAGYTTPLALFSHFSTPVIAHPVKSNMLRSDSIIFLWACNMFFVNLCNWIYWISWRETDRSLILFCCIFPK